MKKEDLKVGMVIVKDIYKKKVTGLGDHCLIYKAVYDEGEGGEDLFPYDQLDQFEPYVEKQKIKLFRYTYEGSDKVIYESNWSSLVWDNWLLCDSTLLKTEEKEIEI